MADDRIDSSDRPAPNRRDASFSFYTKVVSTEARRLRRGITLANFLGTLKTMAWVAPLTLLIWVYAERELDVPRANVAVAIGIQESDPNLVVTLVRPSDGNITCSLEGPRSKIDEVVQLLQPHGNTPSLMVALGSLPIGPSNPIPLLAKIQNDPKFVNNGVSVTLCSPENLFVAVDRLSEYVVQVEPPQNLPNVEATFTPSTVKIKGPETVLKQLRDEHRLVVTADIAGLPEINKPGVHPGINVSLLPPSSDPNITLSASTTVANLTVQTHDISYRLDSVNVDIEIPGGLQDEYKVRYDRPLLTDITVSGPPDKIEEIRRGDFVPVARLVLSKDELKNPKPTKFKIDLPPGVTLAPGTNIDVTPTVIPRG